MRLSKQFAVSLALAAMLLRALLPDGWMPAAAASGTPFVICSVDGVHTGGKGTPTQPSREHGGYAATTPRLRIQMSRSDSARAASAS